ncbi:unnamed protein product [Vitrella brassicaformis CCMP3155]|uniref:Uncharacterized protein n=2 Tax=Vitrella brassicaformis TaxID=1169539 RepID=A0A0G4EWT4_VITBC|nr:unnamed protein product [Vitrella brassicaformis CCMP3155]|eukprot:CEM03223.1 unnamed protein product [Vitrella brassicaformis CCMP3155]
MRPQRGIGEPKRPNNAYYEYLLAHQVIERYPRAVCEHLLRHPALQRLFLDSLHEMVDGGVVHINEVTKAFDLVEDINKRQRYNFVYMPEATVMPRVSYPPPPSAAVYPATQTRPVALDLPEDWFTVEQQRPLAGHTQEPDYFAVTGTADGVAPRPPPTHTTIVTGGLASHPTGASLDWQQIHSVPFRESTGMTTSPPNKRFHIPESSVLHSPPPFTRPDIPRKWGHWEPAPTIPLQQDEDAGADEGGYGVSRFAPVQPLHPTDPYHSALKVGLQGRGGVGETGRERRGVREGGVIWAGDDVQTRYRGAEYVSVLQERQLRLYKMPAPSERQKSA